MKLIKTIKALLLLCVLLPQLTYCTDYDHTIYVDPSNPNRTNDTTCYISSEQQPCADINFALAFPSKGHSTKFVLSSSTKHILLNNSTSTLFVDSTQVAFVGDNGRALVECESGAGLAFINCTDFVFQQISFQFCGAWRKSTSMGYPLEPFQLLPIRVGLYFYNCRDVTMTHMSVSNSTEAVGVVMYSTAGVNYIGYSQFENNRISKNNKNNSGGGGFAVEFNYCKPGDTNCSESNHQTENYENVLYTFEHCSFSYNHAEDHSGNSFNGISYLPRNQTHSSMGRGGGLSIFFKATAMSNSITVDNCTFQQNHANWGGGLFVQFADQSINNTVTIANSKFIRNHCYYENRESGETGGGALVSSPVHYSYKRENLDRNEITFNNCFFTGNRAVTGGALAFVYTLQRLSHSFQIFQAQVLNSNFVSNFARLGSAIAVDHEYFYHQGLLGEMIISNCSFHSNKIKYADTKHAFSIGIGAVYISEVKVTFQGLIEFWNNIETALALVGTRIVFYENSTLNFTANHGASGGAIALLGVSSILIGENTYILFENNRATKFGGAIYNSYTGKEDLRSSVKCFIQYDYPFADPNTWNTQFLFINNSAGKLGNAIYSTTILPCSWSESLLVRPEIIQDIFCWNESIWRYENSNCSDQIYTAPHTFHNLSVTKDVKVYPGHPFQLDITTGDDLGHDVTIDTIYTARIISGVAEIDPQYAYVANGSLGINGKDEQNITLQLDVNGNRDWRLEVQLYMENCPLGFKLSQQASQFGNDSNKENAQKGTKCVCIGGDDNIYTYGGHLICDKANLTSKIRNGYWIGLVPSISNTEMLMGSTKLLVWNIPENYLTLSESQCSHLNRTGPLCGECLDGYSTAVNSFNYECVPCSTNTTNIGLNIFAYVSLTYLPYLVLFLVIIYFDIRLMNGPIVGFILFAQLIGSGVLELTVDRLPFSSNSRMPYYLQKGYRLVYGLFNLNSFSEILDPFCVHEHFNALDVICLDYGIAFFPLLLILIIKLLIFLKDTCKFEFRRRRNHNLSVTENNEGAMDRRNLIHAFVGFLYLSYTKWSLTATLQLTTTGVFDINGLYILSPRLLYYAGQFYFGQPEYILPYGLIAILVFAVVAVIPFFLIGVLDGISWLADKSDCIHKMWPSGTVNRFLEATTSCYRPNRRYFAGIYFLFRLIMLVIFAFSSDLLTQVLCQLLFIILMIILVAIMLPYKSMLHNITDILLFLNLAAIQLISVYLYSAPSYNISSTYPIQLYIFGSILIWLPFVYFLCYLCSLLIQKTCTQTYECTVTKIRENAGIKLLISHFSNADVFQTQRRFGAAHDLTFSQGSIKGEDIDKQYEPLTESMMLLNRAEDPNKSTFRRGQHSQQSREPSHSTIIAGPGLYGEAVVKQHNA